MKQTKVEGKRYYFPDGDQGEHTNARNLHRAAGGGSR